MPSRYHAGALLLLCLLLYLPGLGTRDLWAPNEPNHAQVAREMLQSGDWLVPRMAGRPYEGKPPLFHWTIAIASLPAGDVGQWSARLPSALAAILTVLALYALARRLLGAPGALVAAAALATSLKFLWQARWAEPDALLCACVTLAFLSHLRALDGPPAWHLAEGAAVGLAIMTKGPVALLFTLLPLIVFHAWERRGVAWLWALGGALLAVAIPVAWLAAASTRGYDVWGVLGTQVVDRTTSGLHHHRPIHYYVQMLPLEGYPLLFFLPAGLLLAWRERKERWARLAVSWFLPALIVMSLIPEKRGVYLLPLYPALALLAGRLLDPREASIGTWRRRNLLVWTVFGAIPLVLFSFAVAWGAVKEYPSIRAAGLTVAAGMLLLGLGVIVAVWKRPRGAAVALLLGCGVLWAVAGWGAAGLDAEKSARVFGEAVRDTRPGEPLAYYGQFRPATLFYSGRMGPVLELPREAAAFLEEQGGGLLVLDEEAQPELSEEGVRVRAILRREAVGHRTMLLVDAELPPGPGRGHE